jgi:hypothetical protein
LPQANKFPGGIVTLANVAIYLVLIVFVIARRMTGRTAVPNPLDR